MPPGQTRWLTRWWKRHREATFVSLGVLELLYLFATIPVRIALLFDPHLTKNTTQGWTSELIVLSAFDLIAELTNVATLAENARRRRWAVAAPAALALQRSAPKQRRNQQRRGPHLPTEASSQSNTTAPAHTGQAWSLNSLLPPATGTQMSKGAVLLEALAIAPLEALAWSLGPNALHLLRIAKLFRLYRTPQVAVRLARLHAKRRVVQRLLLTGYTLVLRRVMLGIALCHVIACGYVALAHWQCGVHLLYCRRAWLSLGASLSDYASVSNDSNFEVPREDTCWAIEDQLVGATALRKYARALYWSARTLTTLGYYDVAPMTNMETIFAICAQIIGAVFTTSLLAMFIFLFRHLNERQQAFMTRLDDAKEFMALSRIPDDVRQDVTSYLHEEWRSYRGVTLRDVLNKLPEYLRVGLHKELVAHRLSSVGFLAKESLVFVNTLAQRVERCVYSPKDWVIEQAADGMFFVQRGTVLLVDSARQVTEGDHFADVALLYEDRADERARAQTFCELLKLPQRWFQECVTTFYAKQSDDALERMRSLLSKSDHQAQKMKRLFGQNRAVAAAGDATSRTSSSMAAIPPQKIRWMLPGSLFRKRWSHVRLIALIFVAYEVPYFVMFDTATFPFDAVPRLNIQSVTSYVVEVLCTCDFILRSRFFAFVDPASMILVTDPSYIWERYKTDGMWIDLLSVLPVSTVYEIMFGSRSMIGAGFRLLRMARLRHLIPSVQEVAQLRGLSSKAQVAFTLLIAVTLSIHLIGCLWFAMARFSLNPDKVSAGKAGALPLTRKSCLQDATLFGNCSWVMVDAYSQVGGGFSSSGVHGRRLGSTATIQQKSKYTAKFTYLRSIYWAIVALTTVGYGDIVAFSSSESIFAAIWGFVGGVINCAVVAAMSNLISNMTSSSHHHLDRMSEIDVVLAHYRVSPNIRDQIRQFYHQQVHSHKVASENILLTGLPSRLRHRISMVLHADAVLRLPCYFLDQANERLIRTLTGMFRRGVYQRGDIISHQGTLCEHILVVIRGRANVYTKQLKSLPIGAVGPGMCHGMNEVILKSASPVTVVAATITEVSRIESNTFLSIMNDPRFADQASVIQDLAAEDIECHERSHAAIIRNLMTKKRLHKEARAMTTMFPEDSKLSQQPRRALFRLYWDFLLLGLNVYNVFQITYRIAFLASPSHTVRLILVTADTLGDICLAIDILLKLYYFECDGGFRNLLTRRERDEGYASRQLKIDLIALAPLCYFFNSFFIASLCRLPRLLHIRQLSGSFDILILRVQRKISSGNDVSALLAPIKLLVILVLVAHLGACVFYGISSSDNNANAWTHHDPVVHESHGSPPVLYLRALYWSLTTVTLVGSREIVPLDIAGTLFACVACLCCTFVVGHVVGELSDMILDMNKAKKQLHDEKSSLEELARRHGLPPSIRSRAQHYLQYKYTHRNGMDIYKTLHDLSPSIQVRLMMDLYGSVLRDLCIAPFLSEAQLRGLAVRLNPELFITGDTIIVEGNPGHRLYIIKSGEVVVSWRSTGTIVASLGVGGLFGEVSFFLRGTRRIASVQASRSCELLTIDRPSWDQLMDACASEKDKTEEALVQWARDCMKGYNVMVLETIKDVRRSRLPSPLPDTRSRSSTRTLTRASFLAISESLLGKKSVKPTSSENGAIGAVKQWLSRQQRKVHASYEASSLSDGGSVAGASSHTQSRQRVRRPRGEPIWMPGARPLPFIKASSFKNGTAHQVRPVLLLSHHQRETKKLLTIEEECWRRYKSSIALAGSFATRSDIFRGKTNKHRRESIDDLSVATLMRSRTMTKLSAYPQRKEMISDGVAPNGLQGLRPMIKRSSQPTIDSKNVIHLLSKAAAPNVTAGKARLRRSESLPVFDHRFAEKIAAEVAQSVTQASKTVDVSGEMVQRARQPEFRRMFHLYLWWRRFRSQATWAHQPQRVRARLLSWATLLELGHTVTQYNHNNRIPQEEEERLAEEFFEVMSKLWGVWECWSVIVGAVYAALLPYLICFSSLPDDRGVDRSVDDIATYVYVLDFSCILDLAFKWTLFRGIQRSSITVTGVVLDIFAAIPFDIVVLFPKLINCTSCKWNYLGFLQLNKVIRIYQAKDSSERMVQSISFDFDLSIQDTTLRFLRSVCIFVLFGHWIACGWYRASLYGSLSSATSWFVTPYMLSVEAITSVNEVPYLRRYLRCAHFAVGSITTVFYGDVASTNTTETLVELTVVLLSIFVFGTLVGAHRERLEAIYKHRMQFEQQMVELQTFLANQKVSTETQTRIRTYFVNAWLHNGGDDDMRGTKSLSRLLIEDIAQFSLQRVAGQVSVLKACDDCFLRAVLSSLRHIICAPTDIVVCEGDVNRSMYFIDRGKILVQGRGFELVKGEGDFFGELSLLYGIPRSATCSSMGMSLLYVLEWSAYDRILHDFPEYKLVTRRDWVLVSTVITASVEPRFREIVKIVARMEQATWMELDAIIRKAKQLK